MAGTAQERFCPLYRCNGISSSKGGTGYALGRQDKGVDRKRAAGKPGAVGYSESRLLGVRPVARFCVFVANNDF